MSNVSVQLEVKDINLEEISEAAIVNYIALKVSKAFSEKVGPHWAQISRDRCPVGAERNFNPQTKSFKALQLAPKGTFGPESGSVGKASRLFDLRGMGWRERAKSVNTLTEREFFRGTGANKGEIPDIIEVQKGTLKGAFQHKPGNLKRSIRFVGVRRQGNRVVGTVRAHAPYAKAVDRGFTHRGGRKHGGKGTKIVGRKFMTSPIVNIQEMLKNPATYEG